MVDRKNPHHDGPWMSAEVLARLPALRRQFDLNRDPSIGAQILDLEAARRQQQGEIEGSGSGMVRADKPRPEAKPPPEMRRDTDAENFSGRWLEQQRDTAMRNARRQRSRGDDGPERGAPSPGRSPQR